MKRSHKAFPKVSYYFPCKDFWVCTHKLIVKISCAKGDTITGKYEIDIA